MYPQDLHFQIPEDVLRNFMLEQEGHSLAALSVLKMRAYLFLSVPPYFAPRPLTFSLTRGITLSLPESGRGSLYRF